MGFKQQLLNFEKAKVKTKPPQTQKKTEAKLPKKGTPESAYRDGVKDMEQLRSMFSKRFCKHLVFILGFSRKGPQSDPLIRSYCDGFNDKLEDKA